jgi:hypothetical protein
MAIGRSRFPAAWIEFIVHDRSFFCVGMLDTSQKTLSSRLPALGADAYRLETLSLVTHGAGTRVAETRAGMHLDSYSLLTLANATYACLPPVGLLITHRGVGGERSEGMWVSS